MAKTQGKGSIYQLEKDKARGKCRKWRLIVSLGRDPHSEGARYLQKTRSFHGTYTEAQRALRAFIEECESGGAVPRKTWTYDQYAEHFVKAREASGKFTKRTIATNRNELRSLGRLVGNLKLLQITPDVLETAYADLRAGANGAAGPISGTTLFNVNRTAYLMFSDACKKGILGANPLDLVQRPKKDTKPKRALPGDMYRGLLAALDTADEHECAVFLCASLGLRRSESIAVTWGDIDFSEATISIHASLDEDGSVKEPKTEAGYRLLPLAETVAEALMRRKAAQVAAFLETEPKYVIVLDKGEATGRAGTVEIEGRRYDLAAGAPVVCDRYGSRIKPHTISVWWIRNRGRFGLEGWTLHELRHSFLSAAAANGVHPAVMQQLAGHRSAATTMEIYTHVNMAGKRDAVETLQAAYM